MCSFCCLIFPFCLFLCLVAAFVLLVSLVLLLWCREIMRLWVLQQAGEISCFALSFSLFALHFLQRLRCGARTQNPQSHQANSFQGFYQSSGSNGQVVCSPCLGNSFSFSAGATACSTCSDPLAIGMSLAMTQVSLSSFFTTVGLATDTCALACSFFQIVDLSVLLADSLLILPDWMVLVRASSP